MPLPPSGFGSAGMGAAKNPCDSVSPSDIGGEARRLRAVLSAQLVIWTEAPSVPLDLPLETLPVPHFRDLRIWRQREKGLVKVSGKSPQGWEEGPRASGLQREDAMPGDIPDGSHTPVPTPACATSPLTHMPMATFRAKYTAMMAMSTVLSCGLGVWGSLVELSTAILQQGRL